MKCFLTLMTTIGLLACIEKTLPNKLQTQYVKQGITNIDTFVLPRHYQTILDGVELLLLEKIEQDSDMYAPLAAYKSIANKQDFQDSVFTLYREFSPGGGSNYWKNDYSKEQRRQSISQNEFTDFSTSKDTFFALQGTLVGGHRHKFIYFFTIKKGIMTRFYVDGLSECAFNDLAISTLDKVEYRRGKRYPDIYITDIDFNSYRLRYDKKRIYKAKLLEKYLQH